MKSNRPYLIVLPTLLVLGILLLWVADSLNARTASPVSFSCGEVEECFEEQLDEDTPGNPLASGNSPFASKVRKACFIAFPGTDESSNADCPSGWIMPLLI